MNNHWETIYEITGQSLHFGWLAPLGMGAVFFLVYYYTDSKNIFKKYFPFVVSLFLLIMTVYLGFGNIYGLFELKKRYRDKQYEIAEGYVKNFKPGKTKIEETYSVNNIEFIDGRGGLGYDGIWENDGRIHEGVYVRLYYIVQSKRDKTILRIDIKK